MCNTERESNTCDSGGILQEKLRLAGLYASANENCIGDVTDPISDDTFFGLWHNTAQQNSRIYESVFDHVPRNAHRQISPTCYQHDDHEYQHQYQQQLLAERRSSSSSATSAGGASSSSSSSRSSRCSVVGEVVCRRPPAAVALQKMQSVRGHLTLFPVDYLADAKLGIRFGDVEWALPMIIFT